MEFEWDDKKAALNERKHHVPFLFAMRVFLDPNRLEWADTGGPHTESRWITVGLVEGFEIVVAYTLEVIQSGSFPQERQSDMSVKTTGTVRFTLDPTHPPALTKKARARLSRMSDSEIDFTDIPATHGVAWKRGGLLVPEENKRQITLRIDADVLAFFRSTGTRYQTRMNQVLRSYMAAQRQAVSQRPRGR